MDMLLYALLNKKIKSALTGLASAIISGTNLVFTFNDGTTQTMVFPIPKDGQDGVDGQDGKNGADGKDGLSITDIDINEDNELICTLSDGSTINAGKFPDSGTEISYEDFQKLTDAEKANRTYYVYDDESGEEGKRETFERTDSTLATVGGLAAGSSIYGKTANEVIEEMLYPYQSPVISFTIFPSTTTYSKGNVVTSLNFTISATRKSKDIQSISIYDGSTLVTSIVDDVAAGGTFTYSYSCSISTSTTLKVIVNDGTKSVTSSKALNFVNTSYYGTVADGTVIDETTIISLQNSTLKTSKTLAYSGISCTDSKIVYAYPQSFGLLTNITDDNGFSYIDSYENSIITINGENYYVYVMIDPTTLDNFKQKFE